MSMSTTSEKHHNNLSNAELIHVIEVILPFPLKSGLKTAGCCVVWQLEFETSNIIRNIKSSHR